MRKETAGRGRTTTVKSAYRQGVRIAVSAGVLSVIALKVDLSSVVLAARGIALFPYLTSLAIALVAAFVISLKYHILSRASNGNSTFWRAVEVNFIARFFGLLVPSGVGQGAVRWYKMTKDGADRAYFLAATVFERLVFLTMALLFVLLPLYTSHQPPPVEDLRLQLLPIVAVFVLGLIVGFVYLLVPGIQSWLGSLIQKSKSDRYTAVRRFVTRFTLATLPTASVASVVLLSALWQIFYVARVHFLFLSVGQPMGLFDVSWIASLVFLVQLLPISLAGLGVREGAYVYVLGLYGLPASNGFLVGALFFSHMLVFACIGGILNITEANPQKQG